MKFKKFLESCKSINEAEYNKEWWDSKSPAYQKRYIERHPNSIYAQKANLSSKQKKVTAKPRDVISADELESIRTKSGNINLNKLLALMGKPPLKSKK